MFSIARPDAFLLILLIIPTVLYSYYKFKKISHVLRGLFPETSGNFDLNYARLRRTILLRSVFLALCWIFLSLAFARISFGTRNVPVQKSGNAVSMVFDISWSMTANDEKNGVSRLDAVKSYAGSLIDAMNGESISVVLAKGDGIIVVPLTEDMSAVDSVLESLSPSLMTSGGSSIGKGIEAAISTFPRNSAQNFHVWVFTDGDETDSEMKQSFDSAVKYGIPVTVIGFGSEQGQLIMSGDGITPVHTKLQAQKIREYAFEANRNSVIPQYGKSGMRSFIRYVEAGARGSAAELIDSLSDQRTAGRSSVDFAYEVQSVPRQGLFLLLAIVFFVLSIAANEFNLSGIKKRKTASLTMLVFMSLFMSGCTDNFGKSAKILSGTWNYY
ncbi:MAG: VWA domain-containing protein, partial [Treponema sp.]|nr:VWA domain-containing protein [Treponema sp.]